MYNCVCILHMHGYLISGFHAGLTGRLLRVFLHSFYKSMMMMMKDAEGLFRAFVNVDLANFSRQFVDAENTVNQFYMRGGGGTFTRNPM